MPAENLIRSAIALTMAYMCAAVSLPAPWKQKDIGAFRAPGQTSYDGVKFIINGSGYSKDSTKDACHFTYLPLESEGEITARLVSQPGHQLSKTGLMMRESLAANSIYAALFLDPVRSGKVEASTWQSMLVSRSAMGYASRVKNTGPERTSGEITGAFWLRLVRKYNSFYAFTSMDGKTWTLLGSTFVEMKKQFFAGIAVSSAANDVTATVVFDNIIVPGWKSGE